MREENHRGCARQRILHLYPFPRHCPVQLPLHLQQVLIHPRVLCKFRILKNDIGDGPVEKFSPPIHEVGSKKKGLESVKKTDFASFGPGSIAFAFQCPQATSRDECVTGSGHVVRCWIDPNGQDIFGALVHSYILANAHRHHSDIITLRFLRILSPFLLRSIFMCIYFEHCLHSPPF